ncbi:PBP1A family penicillin-binding protein [bacterium]|nr:PBP1A family penicillin-binding protein [bacterium]
MKFPDQFILKIKKINLKKLKNINKRKTFQITLITALLIAACSIGTAVGFYIAIMENLPSFSQLEEYEPGIITSIYSNDGEVIGEYALEKRIEVSSEKIPEILKKALIATEDPRFYKHNGIDFLGILRAAKENILNGGDSGKLQGGSTISQQLVRTLLLHRRQTLRRKLKEWILALKLEKNYTKKQILTLYCNQFALGHGAHGVEAASQLYFGKHVSQLNLEEAALLAGIFRGPYLYSPHNKPQLTLNRRNHVLNRMVVEGFLSKKKAQQAKKAPMEVLPLHRTESEFAAYFNEEVRKYLEKNYGVEALYKGGLKVHTTLNMEMQRFAEKALKKGVRTLDKRQGWRDDKRNLLEEDLESLEKLDEAKIPHWPPRSWLQAELKEGDILEALVLSVSWNNASVRIKDFKGEITNRDIDWTQTKNLKKLIQKGDVIHIKINRIDESNKEFLASLDQEPKIEGSFLAIDPHTGKIKAMVGGYSFLRSKFNRATQAKRQPGSAIKPILYTAALENGFTPADIIVDSPTEFDNKWSEERWSPENYDQKYKGAVTVRMGLEQSRNIVTAKLLQYISPQAGVNYCHKFGITSPVYPYLSLALGTFEMKLIELVSAYSTFPNKGTRMKPYFITQIEDKEKELLEENGPHSEKVISPQTAYMMTSLLQGVVKRGTAQSARYLDKPLAGKTGTTDDYTDAWFIGFSPDLCAGVWVGHDDNETIGERQSGAVAALPIWIEFFQRLIKKEQKETAGQKKAQANEKNEGKEEGFEVPPNLSFVEIDRKTGLLATPVCLHTFKEVFSPGTEPQGFCSLEDHLMVWDYYNRIKK